MTSPPDTVTPVVIPESSEDSNRQLVVFGKDLGAIPCFRNSFLYGLSGGFGAGIMHFAFSSRVRNATRFGFWSYIGITSVYWVYCRYDYSVTKFKYSKMQHGLQQFAAYEGTEKDPSRKDM